MEPPAPSGRSPTRGALIRPWLVIAAVCVGWLPVLWGHYLWLHLAANLWIFSVGVIGLLWGWAAICTFVAVVLARRRPAAMLAIAVCAVAGYAVVSRVEWRSVFRDTWLAAQRPWFDRAVQLADEGVLGPELDDYYGAPLPGGLARLSVNGRIASIGTCGGEEAWFIAQFVGLPDGAAGYVHLTCERPPAPDRLDLYGDFATRFVPMGAGWWWVE